MSKTTVKPGTLINVTRGAYSDYCTIGWFVCVQEFCPQDLLAEFLTANPEQAEDWHFEDERFLAFVISKGVIAEVARFFDEWLLTQYSRAKEIHYMPKDRDAE